MSPSPHLGVPQAGRTTTLDRPATRPRRLARAGVVALTCGAVFAASAAPAHAGLLGARASADTGSSAATTTAAAGAKSAFTAPKAATTTTAQAAAAAVPPIFLGAVGDVSTLKTKTGSQLGVHMYGSFAGSVPTGRMLTVGSGERWSVIAAAKPGSKLYSDIVRWAQTIKGRQGRILVAFEHEPELPSKTGEGTPQDFINAFRRVVTIFRQQGVQNVSYTWQMTDWAFRTKPSERNYAAKWYPGDAYVDTVGADAYNWYTCGPALGRWVELSTLFGPAIAFAKAHGKKASLPEFASHVGPLRAQWLDHAHSYLAANKSTVQAVFYFNHPPTNPANQDCRWNLATSAEYNAYGAMARATANFTP